MLCKHCYVTSKRENSAKEKSCTVLIVDLVVQVSFLLYLSSCLKIKKNVMTDIITSFKVNTHIKRCWLVSVKVLTTKSQINL